MMRRGLMLCLAGALACGGGFSQRERAGDDAVARLAYAEAVAAYRAAAEADASPRILAKLGWAALEGAQLSEAVAAFQRLGADEPDRREEALEGLVRTARAADATDNPVALEAAFTALRGLGAERQAIGPALALARRGRLEGPEAVAALPLALAAAPDAGVVDSLLAHYGAALERASDCPEAISAYRAAQRRAGSGRWGGEAAAGLARCAVLLGERLLRGEPWTAEEWFREAIRVDSNSDTGRRALIGLGEARLLQGDVLGAAIAYQGALAGSQTTDSLSLAAAARLNALASSPEPSLPDDSANVSVP